MKKKLVHNRDSVQFHKSFKSIMNKGILTGSF